MGEALPWNTKLERKKASFPRAASCSLLFSSTSSFLASDGGSARDGGNVSDGGSVSDSRGALDKSFVKFKRFKNALFLLS